MTLLPLCRVFGLALSVEKPSESVCMCVCLCAPVCLSVHTCSYVFV